eukprot:scaffold11245_cov90-Phaeocystis_antarctica.AAC.1
MPAWVGGSATDPHPVCSHEVQHLAEVLTGAIDEVGAVGLCARVQRVDGRLEPHAANVEDHVARPGALLGHLGEAVCGCRTSAALAVAGPLVGH